MADNNDHSHTKSIAYLQEQGKVTNYELQQNEFHQKSPSELQQVEAAALVTDNKDSYAPTQDDGLDLQSGPPKKYIDQPAAVPLSNFAAANIENDGGSNNNDNNNINNTNNNKQVSFGTNNGPNPTDSLDAFAPTSNQQEQQNYESFFGDENNNNNNQNREDDDDNNVVNENEDEKQDEEPPEEEEENKQTFLSVWQEQHREQLTKKGKEEREAQQVDREKGKKELDEFNEKRRLQIESARKEAKSRENDLKEDYNSVFKNGTIWQQVAKLVDLKTENPNLTRFRDLLIHLKNQDE
eukprot:320288_1